MCGRFTLSHTIHDVLQAFDLEQAFNITPSYNIAPTQTIPVIHFTETIQVTPMRWGLIPFWMKHLPKSAPMINARAETVSEKPSFRAAFKKRRCLIPADGFFEWKKTSDGKQPYYIYSKDQGIMAFAGLWETWTNDKESIISCTIITTAANSDMNDIHERMPLILSPENYRIWLTTEDPIPLLQPPPANRLKMHAVSRRVNSPKNNDKHCVEAILSDQ